MLNRLTQVITIFKEKFKTSLPILKIILVLMLIVTLISYIIVSIFKIGSLNTRVVLFLITMLIVTSDIFILRSLNKKNKKED